LGESPQRYNLLIERPADLEDILQHGAKRPARWRTPFLNELREAVGLRSFVAQTQVAATTKKKSRESRAFCQLPRGRRQFPLPSAGGRWRTTAAVAPTSPMAKPQGR